MLQCSVNNLLRALVSFLPYPTYHLLLIFISSGMTLAWWFFWFHTIGDSFKIASCSEITNNTIPILGNTQEYCNKQWDK